MAKKTRDQHQDKKEIVREKKENEFRKRDLPECSIHINIFP